MRLVSFLHIRAVRSYLPFGRMLKIDENAPPCGQLASKLKEPKQALACGVTKVYSVCRTKARDQGMQQKPLESLYVLHCLAITLGLLGVIGCGSGWLGLSGPVPEITAQPASQTVEVGQSATFVVSAVSTTAVTYQWSKNGTPIIGATTNSYTTPTTTTADNGSIYTVTVSNAARSATSAPATLIVTGLSSRPTVPTLTSPPANQTVPAGQQATFSVTTTGTVPFNYQWYRDGSPISGATSTSYTTPATIATDNGSLYTVTVTNAEGSVTSPPATLTVIAVPLAPAITTQPASQTVTVGQPATFNVTATGTGPLTYQWTRNGAPIVGATSTSYSTPVSVAGDNGSLYSVTVSNAEGTVTSIPATLTVNTPPVIPTQPAQTLKFIEKSLTVHVGDEIPPLTWTNTGFAGTDTWRNAVGAGGMPSQSTTYTPSSGVGTYPITITQGTMVPQGGYSFAFVNGTITVEAATGMGDPSITVSRQPAGMMQSMTVANSVCAAAVGDGVTDDTAAINCYLSTGRPTNRTFGRTPKQFYLPGGTVANPRVYLVSGQILAIGSAISVTGDGWNKTIIKLAAASAGYTASNQFIFYEGGFAEGANNNGYNEHFENIGVEIGPGNPGTRGLEFIGNNISAVRNVRVWFDDSKGEAAFSVDTPYPGQTLFKNIAGYGGSYCFKATSEQKYNSVIYNMTCENQTAAGIITRTYNVAASNYFSVNTVPAWTNNAAVIALIGGELIGGGAGQSALTNESEGSFYARNITTAGYTNSMVDANGGVTLTTGFSEHWSGTPQTLFSSAPPTGIIISPVLDTPLPNDPSPATWCALGPDPTTWSATLAACPSTTAYVPVACNYPGDTTDCSQIAISTGYYSPTTLGNINVVIPANINHILGNNYTTAGATINYIISANASTPIILDHFNSTINHPIVVHNSPRTVVFEDSGSFYSCSSRAGPVFFEDAEIDVTQFCPGQSIFARALDDEAEGQILAVYNVAYVSATHTLTLSLNVDPKMVVGSYIYFVGIRPATWLSNSAALVTNISGGIITAKWFGTNPNYSATAQTTGNYRVQLDKVTCNGCSIWSLGWKSEHASTDFTLTNGKLEIDGFNQYPVRPSPPEWQGFKLIDTNAFLTGESFYIGGNQRQYFVTETRLGSTLNLANPAYGTQNNSTLNMFFSTGNSTQTARFSGNNFFKTPR